MKSRLPALVLLCLLARPVAAEPLAESLQRADEALAEGRIDEACSRWLELLEAPPPAPEIAFFRLSRWWDACALAEALPRMTNAARRQAGSPRALWRAYALTRKVARKYRQEELADSLRPVVLKATTSTWLPLSAPNWVLFTGLPWPEQVPDEGLGVGSGGAAVTRHCFAVREEVPLLLRLELPNPGRVLLDSQELATVPPDLGRRFPVVETVLLDLPPGTHVLDAAQAVSGLTVPVTVSVLPANAVVTAECPATWPAVGWQHHRESTVEAPPLVEEWRRLANDEATFSGELRSEAGARESFSGLLLYLAELRSPATVAGDARARARETLASYVNERGGCMASLLLARRYLQAGEANQAQQVLDRVDDDCRNRAYALQSRAEVAQWRQWGALYDRLLEEGHSRFPEQCALQEPWFERQLERGLASAPASLPVYCPAVERLYAAREQRPSKVPLEGFVRAWEEAGMVRRQHLVAQLLEHLLEPPWQALADALVERHPQVAWELADRLLAAGRREEALAWAALARAHRGTWGTLRTQAGRLFAWLPLKSYLEDIESRIEAYQDADFAAGMPQVMVLDELVVTADEAGWLTLLETTVLHLDSPDAAESVGELSLRAGEEVVELAVRKADGTWVAPEARSGDSTKETISLPGLSAGDFLVRRTIREVPRQTGADPCFEYPSFVFTHREYPVFLSRYVVVGAGDDLQVTVRGNLDRRERLDGALVLALERVMPVPAEPGSTDPTSGLVMAWVASGCYDWNRLRDRLADNLVGYCNTPLPGELEGLGPDALYQAVVGLVEEDGSGLFAAPFSAIWERGRGNRTLALYCALNQAGYPAHVVAINTAAGRPLDWNNPSLAPFDGMAVHVAGMQPRWYDPFDELAPPGYLRLGLREREGLVLTPLFPRLFLRTPRTEVTEGWSLNLAGEVADDGSLAGTLTISATGGAAIDFERGLREATPKQEQRIAQSLLAQVLPGAGAGELRSERPAPGKIRFRIRFTGQIDVTRAGRLLVVLPPVPRQDLASLASRTSPLYYGGSLPTELDVDLRFARGLRIAVDDVRETLVSPFGTAALRVEASDSRLRIHKSAAAPPIQVQPEEYRDFVEYVAHALRLSSLNVGVLHGSDG